jgi:hypothetical protein
MPTSTTSLFPEVIGDAAVNARLATPGLWAETCCTNAALTVAVGVTVFEGDDGGLLPIAFLAVTVNVYAVPLTRPLMVAPVAGGEPETVVAVWAVVPT